MTLRKHHGIGQMQSNRLKYVGVHRYTAIIRAGAMCGDLGLSARYLMAMMEASFSPSLSLLEEVGWLNAPLPADF